MLSLLKDMFAGQANESNDSDQNNEHKLQVAACALLIEIANADEDFSEDEKNRITEIMKKLFNLSDSEVTNLIAKSTEEIENSVSLYEFTNVLNSKLSSDERYSIIKYLWQIAYSDNDLDAYEDHYIKKISNNLHIYNKERIAAKLEVKKELGI